MSRIYEALQLAERERNSKPNPQDECATTTATLVAQPVAAITPADPISPAPQAWKPLFASLPALGDRGECIEQFRSLRSHLYLQRLQHDLKCVLISSGMPEEGKTFVAANLAITLARNNERPVLLIDGDLRRSSLHKRLGAPVSPGLSDYLAGTATLSDVIHRQQEPADHDGRVVSNLAFIAAGESAPNSFELVGNRRIEELIAALSPHFDWIVIDAPPVLAVTDAVDLASAADAVLLVAREAKTPYDVAQRAQEAFSKSRLLGFVLNAVKHAPAASYYSYYYDGQGDARKASKVGGHKRSRT